jgi:hypothetical protein
MPARIRLPDGRAAAIQFSASVNPEIVFGYGKLLLYFSEGVELLLADYLELPFLKVVQIEKVSFLDGISLQIQLEDGAALFPRNLHYHGPNEKVISGSITPGLFNWFWNLQIPGPIPQGPFRLCIEFA